MSEINSSRTTSGRVRRGAIAVTATSMAILLGAPALAGAAAAQRNRDITVDGHEDLITRSAEGNLVVYPHSGAFDPANPSAAYGEAAVLNHGWANAEMISAADMNADGKPEIVAEANGALTMYRHTGAYDPANPEATLGESQQLGGLGWDQLDQTVLADFGGDGSADILTRANDGHLYVFPTTVGDDASVQIGEKQLFARDFAKYDQIDATDLNGDGSIDLAARADGVLYGFLTVPGKTGVDANVNVITLDDAWGDAETTEFKDVNSDDKADLVVRFKDGNVFTRLNTGADGAVSFGDRLPLGDRWAGEVFLF